ncbi:hypothetical protein LIER_05264 [Lithospermum erythrorhizon]|uniref:Uncharacterized protein n=1 Tax=Lithospermum erythrorhizon TaxID=34254 RepID=A0AAV3P3Z2_LITER
MPEHESCLGCTLELLIIVDVHVQSKLPQFPYSNGTKYCHLCLIHLILSILISIEDQAVTVNVRVNCLVFTKVFCYFLAVVSSEILIELVVIILWLTGTCTGEHGVGTGKMKVRKIPQEPFEALSYLLTYFRMNPSMAIAYLLIALFFSF